MGRFRWLCEEHRDRIYTFAFYYMGNREDAEDITQEVLFRLWQHSSHMDDRNVAAWLTRVARNACLDALRKRRRYRSVVSAQDPDPALQRTAAPEVCHVDLRRQLEAALTRLKAPTGTLSSCGKSRACPTRKSVRTLRCPSTQSKYTSTAGGDASEPFYGNRPCLQPLTVPGSRSELKHSSRAS